MIRYLQSSPFSSGQLSACASLFVLLERFFNISPKFTATFPVKNGFAVCFFALIEMNYYTVQKKKPSSILNWTLQISPIYLLLDYKGKTMLPNYLVRKGKCILAKAKRMTKENLKKNAVKSFFYFILFFLCKVILIFK